jgi:hypothetical protein
MNRTDFLLKCKEVRAYLVRAGGATRIEVSENVPNASGCLRHLEIAQMAFRTRDGKWHAAPMSCVEYNVRADLSFEDDA